MLEDVLDALDDEDELQLYDLAPIDEFELLVDEDGFVQFELDLEFLVELFE